MSTELIFEAIYTIIAAVVFVIGARLYFRGGKPLYAKMIVCMLGCRFLQGLLETLLVRSNMDMNTLSISGLGQLAQFLFLICANYGSMDSLCDDGSRAFLKYRLMAGIIPAIMVVVLFVTAGKLTRTPFEMGVTMIFVVVPLIAFYYHFKHLIIKDVEGGVIRRLRFYNLLGVINCAAFFMGWFAGIGTPVWCVSFVLYDVVTISFLPALSYGLKIPTHKSKKS